MVDCEGALRVDGTRHDDPKHAGDELKVDFRVASRVALADRADQEAARIPSAEPEHGEGAVLAHVNGVGAGELGSTPGNDDPTVNDAEGSSGADELGSADVADPSCSALDDAILRKKVSVAAVVEVVLKERRCGRPAELRNAQQVLKKAGTACHVNQNAVVRAGVVLSVIDAHEAVSGDQASAAVRALRTAEARNRDLAKQLRDVQATMSDNQEEQRTRVAALVASSAALAALLTS